MISQGTDRATGGGRQERSACDRELGTTRTSDCTLFISLSLFRFPCSTPVQAAALSKTFDRVRETPLEMSVDEELPPSKLGTKEYWDKVYEREVDVFEDTGDEGEVWFGERAMEKMRDWVYANCPPEQEEQVGSESRKRRIRAMECGCGESPDP